MPLAQLQASKAQACMPIRLCSRVAWHPVPAVLHQLCLLPPKSKLPASALLPSYRLTMQHAPAKKQLRLQHQLVQPLVVLPSDWALLASMPQVSRHAIAFLHHSAERQPH